MAWYQSEHQKSELKNFLHKPGLQLGELMQSDEFLSSLAKNSCPELPSWVAGNCRFYF